MPVHDDNAAGRLYQLLDAVRGLTSMTGNLANAWAHALELQGDYPGLLRQYALILQLPDMAEAELRSISGINHELLLRWREPVAKAFSMEFSTASVLDSFIACYKGAPLDYLEICDDLLHRWRPAAPVDEGALGRTRELVAELQEELLRNDPEIDPEAATFLLYHVNAMARALQDMAVRGPAALQDAVDQALGATTVRRNDLLRKAGQDRATKFLLILQTALVALQVGMTGLQLTQAAEHPAIDGPVIVQVVPENLAHPPAAMHGQGSTPNTEPAH